MRTVFISLTLLAVGSPASAQGPSAAPAGGQTASQLVQLPNGSIGVVSADGVYLGQLQGSLDGSTGYSSPARHGSFVIIANSPTPRASTLTRIAAQGAAPAATPKAPTFKATRIFRGLANGVFMDAPVEHSP